MNVNLNDIPDFVKQDKEWAKAVADAIYDELRQHANMTNRSGVIKFKVGDIVTFNSQINPKYMVGEKARIVKMNRARAKVQMLKPVGRFQGIVNCPYSLFEVGT